MNTKISVFFICVKAIIDLLLHNFQDFTFNHSERISVYTVIPYEVESIASYQHAVLVYISNVLYVEIEFQEPFPAATCGGRIPYSSKELVNTWPIDGTLTRVLCFMALTKHFNAYIVENLPFLMQILESFETGDSVKEKVFGMKIKPRKIVVNQEANS